MKKFDLVFTAEAKKQLLDLKKSKSKIHMFKSVGKTLYLMQRNLRHPSLNTHEFTELSRIKDYKVFESYAQNKTSGAYRVFWKYGPEKNQITILALTPHP